MGDRITCNKAPAAGETEECSYKSAYMHIATFVPEVWTRAPLTCSPSVPGEVNIVNQYTVLSYIQYVGARTVSSLLLLQL